MIKVNPGIWFDRIGDLAFMEPALCRLGEERLEEISFHVNPRLWPMFRFHPWIRPHHEPHKDPDFTLSSAVAFNHSFSNMVPMASGFYDQVGIKRRPNDRLHYKSYTDLSYLATCWFSGDTIVIPYSYSCGSRVGNRPNIQPPIPWWENVIPRLPGRVTVLCGNDKMDYDKEYKNARVVRGLPLGETIEALSYASVILGINTGLIHLVSYINANVVYLSATPKAMYAPRKYFDVFQEDYADLFDADFVVKSVKKALA